LENYLNYSESKIEVLFLLAQIASEEKDFPSALAYLQKLYLLIQKIKPSKTRCSD
jgi:cytochrome c-type biogenesis protein CcmH/NrfG